jgi:hypothetical protein
VKASIADIAIKVENDRRENVMKLAQADDTLTNMVHATLHKDLQLSNTSARWVTKMVYYEMQKKRVRTCKALTKDPRRFMTILDNILNLGESAGGEEQAAGLTHTNEASYMEWEGVQKNGAAMDFAKVLRQQKKCCETFC